jgi:AcrR family transcriptional regulator
VVKQTGMKAGAKPRASSAERARRPRPGGRSERVVAAVLEATLAELARAGFDALSIPEVAALAGVHPTSVYRRWPGKLDLVMAACLRSAGAAMVGHDRGSLRGDLQDLLAQVDRFLRTPAGAAMVALAVSSTEDPARARYVRRYWSERLKALEGIFERAMRRGDWPVPLRLDVAVELLIGPIYVRRFITQRPCTKAYIAEVVARAIDSDGPAAAVDLVR